MQRVVATKAHHVAGMAVKGEDTEVNAVVEDVVVEAVMVLMKDTVEVVEEDVEHHVDEALTEEDVELEAEDMEEVTATEHQPGIHMVLIIMKKTLMLPHQPGDTEREHHQQEILDMEKRDTHQHVNQLSEDTLAHRLPLEAQLLQIPTLQIPTLQTLMLQTRMQQTHTQKTHTQPLQPDLPQPTLEMMVMVLLQLQKVGMVVMKRNTKNRHQHDLHHEEGGVVDLVATQGGRAMNLLPHQGEEEEAEEVTVTGEATATGEAVVVAVTEEVTVVGAVVVTGVDPEAGPGEHHVVEAIVEVLVVHQGEHQEDRLDTNHISPFFSTNCGESLGSEQNYQHQPSNNVLLFLSITTIVLILGGIKTNLDNYKIMQQVVTQRAQSTEVYIQ